MNIQMIHNGRDRDSLLMPMDDRTVDLMLQYSIQLIRCEPTTRITEFRSVDTHASGNGIVRDGSDRLIPRPIRRELELAVPIARDDPDERRPTRHPSTRRD